MKDIDDQDLKAEIERISKKIDAIVEKVGQMDPAFSEKKENERE